MITLDHKYNVLFTSIIRAKYFHGIEIEQINNLYNTKYDSFDSIKNNATILHYSTFDKPWKYSDIDAIEEWDFYYFRSVYSEEKLNRKRLHIKLINMMRKNKLFRLPGTFLWEVETRGITIALKEVKKYVIKEKNK